MSIHLGRNIGIYCWVDILLALDTHRVVKHVISKYGIIASNYTRC